jgi:LysM repeat protein
MTAEVTARMTGFQLPTLPNPCYNHAVMKKIWKCKEICSRLFRNKTFLVSGILIVAWLAAGNLAFGGAAPAQAAPAMQVPIYTPTPGPDGRIIYIVKAGDTLLSISLLTGVPLDTLRSLNNLTSDTIYEGQKLLLGFAGPAETTPTPGPTPTPTQALPTPTPKPGIGNLCLLLFNDINGDSIRQEDEPSIPEGAISFGNRAGTVSQAVTTGSGLDPTCFKDLPEGEYTISVAVPKGYNSTTTTSYELALHGGDSTYVNFGAQANSETLAEAPVIPATEGTRSPILGIIGGLFLALGVVVAIFAGRILRGR